jgi:hypothetical protein
VHNIEADGGVVCIKHVFAEGLGHAIVQSHR